jgi:pimeloyl-ACP methyl ester carboxylesterase
VLLSVSIVVDNWKLRTVILFDVRGFGSSWRDIAVGVVRNVSSQYERDKYEEQDYLRCLKLVSPKRLELVSNRLDGDFSFSS